MKQFEVRYVAALLLVAHSYTPSSAKVIIDGRDVEIEPAPRMIGDRLFVQPDAIARAFKYEAKTVVTGKLIVLCGEVSCRQVHLTEDDVASVDGKPWIGLDRVADAIGYQITPVGNEIRLQRLANADDDHLDKLPVGSILPDASLIDLHGRAVRLSEFAGRRLLICTWASW